MHFCVKYIYLMTFNQLKIYTCINRSYDLGYILEETVEFELKDLFEIFFFANISFRIQRQLCF
jgi:hypothetical protein